MNGIKFFLVITRREYTEQYLDFFKSKGIERLYSEQCLGTIGDSTLSLLGLESNKRIMLKGFIEEENLENVKQGLSDQMKIDVPGNGIFVVLPVGGIGGISAYKQLLGKEPSTEKREKNGMENKEKLTLIITIVDKGNSELVMESARSAGASGGTVVKANGTGAQIAKFFGVSISEEKEMIYIVTSKEKRDDIMKAIMEKAGSNTNAHGIVFALPVESVLGIKSLENLNVE